MKYDIYFNKAKEAHIDELELSISTEYSLSFDWFRGEIESYLTSNLSSLSARGTINGKTGYVNSEKIDRSTADYVINQIIENAKVNNSSDETIIFKGSDKYTKKKVYNPKLNRIPTDEKIAILKEMETKIKNIDERIGDVECSYSESVEEYILMNSYGLNLKSKSNYFVIAVSVVATGEDGQTKTSYKSFIGSDLEQFNLDEFSNAAAKETIDQLNGGPCLSKKYKCVLNPGTVASLIHPFLSNAIADEVQKNTSLFKGKLHEIVASKKLTIEERPLDKNPFFRYFDDEGVATYNKKIINKGVLETYLYNLATAKKDGVESTGNGYRGAGKVGTSLSNIIVRSGKKTEDDIFKTIGEGIYITDVAGLHSGLNSHSGNFSLQAQGFLIEDGKLSKPVCLITIAGNLFDVFKNVKEVASNSERHGSVLTPSLYIKSIAVSGI